LAAIAIHHDLVAMLGGEAISYLSVTDHLREVRLSTSNAGTTFSELSIEPDDCDEAILLVLNEQPFASIRQLTRFTHLPGTIVDRDLTQSLGLQV
jgi:hypothetical protein